MQNLFKITKEIPKSLQSVLNFLKAILPAKFNLNSPESRHHLLVFLE